MKYRIRKRWVAAGSGIALSFALFVFSRCFLVDDRAGYEEMVNRASSQLQSQHAVAAQERTGVRKQFWQVRNNTRLEGFLESAAATLSCEMEGSRSMVVESLEDVFCLVQEDKFYLSNEGNQKLYDCQLDREAHPMQTVRAIFAKNAKYRYSSETLHAAHVLMRTYTLEGHQLPKSLDPSLDYQEGKAESVVITMIHPSVRFEADQAVGSFFP